MGIKEDTLAHYDRMIAWAEKQDHDGICDIYDMRDSIHESWLGNDCPLCEHAKGTCDNCVIFKKTHKLHCNGTPWKLMNYANTWGTWITSAKKERKFLESLNYGE